MDAKQLIEQGDELFGKRALLMSLWQEIALNFYPERADFTVQRVVGTEFAGNLMSSYPVLARRDLGNALGTMLRPTAKPWFHVRTADETREDIDARRWLEWAEQLQRRAMYDRQTQFVRATKEGDHDFAAFGQCAISCELNKNADALLYRSWHLRDMAWAENEQGAIGMVFRKWKPTARVLNALFPGKLPSSVRPEKTPFQEIDCRHMVVESDMYDGTFKTPYVSIYYDVEHSVLLEVIGVYNPIYVIPRWETVSGSQYAYSPATVAALPDARLIQAMTATLLEAGEKFTNPPMIAQHEAIRSDIQIYAGGITWVDREYDERMGDALKVLPQDRAGMPLGMEMAKDCRAIIASAFFLDKIAMPQRVAEMTAYEVGQRVQEYIRQALPLFEPMEMDYNGAICDMTFDILKRAGAFGSVHAMPRSLLGAEIQFRFASPLHDAIESEKEHKFMEAGALLASAVQLDPSAGQVLDAKTALRDALLGAGVPARWQRTDEEVLAMQQKMQQAQNTQALLENLQAGASAAKDLGAAAASFRGAGAPTSA